GATPAPKRRRTAADLEAASLVAWDKAKTMVAQDDGAGHEGDGCGQAMDIVGGEEDMMLQAMLLHEAETSGDAAVERPELVAGGGGLAPVPLAEAEQHADAPAADRPAGHALLLTDDADQAVLPTGGD
ncbi:unnamed protein product, partial [Symbiodinium pilosum]